MRRRTFIAALGCAAAAWPFAAYAQQRIVRIGYLYPLSADDWDKAGFSAFEAGLDELGYVVGKNIEIEFRFANGHEDRMAELARELVDLKVDVIVSAGPGVYAAHSVTKTVPIVAATGGDLVAMGIVASLAHPGGNVTGQIFFFNELVVKRVELLKLLRPTMTRVGLLVIQDNPSLSSLLRDLDASAGALGVDLEPIEVAEPNDCDRALSTGRALSIGGLVVTDMPQFSVGRQPASIASAVARRGLPTVGLPSFPRGGGLLGYGVDFVSMWRRAPTFVDKILKGAKPGDVPIEQATKFETIVNLKTAKALGVEIPPTVLAAADEVIE
jgi:putative tryptophan/tyrosine transport system substrate-binding protein